MDVQDALRELADEPGRKQAHVAGEADEIDLALIQSGYNFAVMHFALFAFGRNHERFEPALARGFDAGSVGPVRNHYRNARARNASSGNAISDGDEVRAAAGEENAEVFHNKRQGKRQK